LLLSIATRRARILGRGGNVVDAGYLKLYAPQDYHSKHKGLEGISATVYRGDPFDPEPLAEITISAPLTPEFTDVYRLIEVVDEAYEGYKIFKRIFEGVDVTGERFIRSELLPVELQTALKRVAETIITAVLSEVSANREVLPLLPVGLLRAPCDPRVEEVRVETMLRGDRRCVHKYTLVYTCNPRKGDDELRLSIELVVDREETHIGEVSRFVDIKIFMRRHPLGSPLTF
jgi:hypothetical protein